MQQRNAEGPGVEHDDGSDEGGRKVGKPSAALSHIEQDDEIGTSDRDANKANNGNKTGVGNDGKQDDDERSSNGGEHDDDGYQR